MNKYISMFVIFSLFVILAACSDDKISAVTPTVNPSAQPLLDTMTVIEKTVEGIAASATVYSFTPTLTVTPTKTPDETAVYNLISNSVNSQLISTFGAHITVESVKFGPIGAQEYTNLYIVINCASDGTTACPTTQVIIAVMEACKEKEKKILDNIPSNTQVLTITIFDPVTRPQIVEINWSDVLAFIDGDIPGNVFSQMIRYTQY